MQSYGKVIISHYIPTMLAYDVSDVADVNKQLDIAEL